MAQELSTFDVQALDLERQQPTHAAAATLRAAPAGTSRPLVPPEAQLGSSAYGHAAQGGSYLAATLQHSAVKPSLPAFQLFPQPRGALESLKALPLDTAAPLAPGQVLVAVKAVGINFR